MNEIVSDGTCAREVIAKFTPRLSPMKQQEEWRWWIEFYKVFGDFFAEDIRLLAELLDKE